MSEAPPIVLCIPGGWESRTALAQALAGAGDTVGLSGDMLNNGVAAARLEYMGHDPDLRELFARAGRLFSETDLAAIATHRSVIYLIGEGGALPAARNMMALAGAVLQAGGLAVKVETSGVAHRAQDWLEHAARRETHIGALLIAYVALIGGCEEVYSCGMHMLGLPDAVVSGGLPPQQAGQWLKDFLLYVLHEQPALHTGQMFGVAGEPDHFTLSHEPCRRFAPDDLFFNPFGVWRLTPHAAKRSPDA